MLYKCDGQSDINMPIYQLHNLTNVYNLDTWYIWINIMQQIYMIYPLVN